MHLSEQNTATVEAPKAEPLRVTPSPIFNSFLAAKQERRAAALSVVADNKAELASTPEEMRN